MLENTKKLTWLRILSAVLLLAVLAVGGTMLFKAGFTQGALAGADGELALPDFGAYGYHMPMRGSHFFPGSFFFGIIFLFLIFGLFRRAFFGPRWAHGARGMRGMHPATWKEGAEKWHAEMHERMENPPEDEPDQPTDE